MDDTKNQTRMNEGAGSTFRSPSVTWRRAFQLRTDAEQRSPVRTTPSRVCSAGIPCHRSSRLIKKAVLLRPERRNGALQKASNDSRVAHAQKMGQKIYHDRRLRRRPLHRSDIRGRGENTKKRVSRLITSQTDRKTRNLIS